jgi:3-deoxy-D-manno-octulosonate 8-phosphate phosphatase (KDO 8-P phosphatase)
LKTVKLLALDVDGTLTDGGLYLSESGESLKRFHAQDGLGIVLAAHVGLEIVWITGSARASTTRPPHSGRSARSVASR